MTDEYNNPSAVSVQHVFVIGAKSIGQYGGFETFVDKITEQHASLRNVKYHIACKANGDGYMNESGLLGVEAVHTAYNGRIVEFNYRNTHVFKIRCPNIGPAVAIYYDWASINFGIHYCNVHSIEHPIFYILTCRIGPFIGRLVKRIRAIGGVFYLNPDGYEWKRAKWNAIIRKYWKWSERKMVLAADLVICDSENIERYIHDKYPIAQTTYIAYGADSVPSTLSDDDPDFTGWLREKGLRSGEYYLVVGRFVPENNYEVIINEFMNSHSHRDLAIITNTNKKLFKQLEKTLFFSKDYRIKFVGTVYNKELLKKIRENAYGYIHGHEVGGTNPSLLEALGSTKLNLLLNVGFNKEVGTDAALYWTKEKGSLRNLIEISDNISGELREDYGKRAKKRIDSCFNWSIIGKKYQVLWLRSR